MASFCVIYVCQLCGEETPIWLDWCPECLYPCCATRQIPSSEYCRRYGHEYTQDDKCARCGES